MHGWGAALGEILAAVSATPSPIQTVDPKLVTPGPAGFVAIALVALAAVALVWDMQRRIRRARYREEVNADLDAEEAANAQARDAQRATGVDDQSAARAESPGAESPGAENPRAEDHPGR